MDNGNRFQRVLVTDFDGTMTRHDFYRLAIDKLIPKSVPDYWVRYRAGSITHFEALRLYFAAIRGSEEDVLSVVQQMELDPLLPSAIESLRSAGWQVVVASAGCEWYMRWLLANAGVDVEIHANPGRFDPQQGLLMELPTASPYFSRMLGIDKAGIVRNFLNQGLTVAFAGDGFPDVEPACLVCTELRFARGNLATELERERTPFHSFQQWSDIAVELLRNDDVPAG